MAPTDAPPAGGQGAAARAQIRAVFREGLLALAEGLIYDGSAAMRPGRFSGAHALGHLGREAQVVEGLALALHGRIAALEGEDAPCARLVRVLRQDAHEARRLGAALASATAALAAVAVEAAAADDAASATAALAAILALLGRDGAVASPRDGGLAHRGLLAAVREAATDPDIAAAVLAAAMSAAASAAAAERAAHAAAEVVVGAQAA